MNASQIESKFAEMGARLKVREIPARLSRWNSNRADYAVDIQRDREGEFFELRVPVHLRDDLEVSVSPRGELPPIWPAPATALACDGPWMRAAAAVAFAATVGRFRFPGCRVRIQSPSRLPAAWGGLTPAPESGWACGCGR